MPFFEFGATQGLAVSPNFEGRIRDKFRGAEMQRRAKLDAENKARVLGDMLKLGKATNRWDHARLKEFSETQLTGIAKYASDNPDYQTDVGKWAEFTKRTNELVDNPIVWRSQRFDSEASLMDKYETDPKNRDYLEDPEFIQSKQQRENYLRTVALITSPPS